MSAATVGGNPPSGSTSSPSTPSPTSSATLRSGALNFSTPASSPILSHLNVGFPTIGWRKERSNPSEYVSKPRVFFDHLAQEIVLFTGAPPNKMWFSDKASQTWKEFPVNLPPHNDIIGAQMSPDRLYVALRVSEKEVKVLSTQTGEVLTARSCHASSSSRMISVHWLRDSRQHGTSIQSNNNNNNNNNNTEQPVKEPMLLFVTNAGVELYCLSQARLKHLKTARYSIVYHWILFPPAPSTGPGSLAHFLAHAPPLPAAAGSLSLPSSPTQQQQQNLNHALLSATNAALANMSLTANAGNDASSVNDNILLLVDHKNVFQAYKISCFAGLAATAAATSHDSTSEGSITKICKFELDCSGTCLNPPAHGLAAFHREQVHIVNLYGRMVILFVNEVKGQLHLLSWNTQKEEMEQTHVFDLYQAGSYSISVLDYSILAVHNLQSKVSMLFDVKSESKTTITEPLPIGPPLEKDMPFYALKSSGIQVSDEEAYAGKEKKGLDFFDPKVPQRSHTLNSVAPPNFHPYHKWTFLAPHYVWESTGDQQQGNLWSLCLNYHHLGISWPSSKRVRLCDFLLKRKNTEAKQFLFQMMQSVIAVETKSAGIALLSRLFNTLNKYLNENPSQSSTTTPSNQNANAPANPTNANGTSSSAITNDKQTRTADPTSTSSASTSTSSSASSTSSSTSSSTPPPYYTSDGEDEHSDVLFCEKICSLLRHPSMRSPLVYQQLENSNNKAASSSASASTSTSASSSPYVAPGITLQYNDQGYMMIGQLDIFQHVFLPLKSYLPVATLLPCVIEYMRSLVRYYIKVEPFINDFLVLLLLEKKEYYTLHQFLQYHILYDSIPIANRLLAISGEYPAAYQLGLDMLFRLNATRRLLWLLLNSPAAARNPALMASTTSSSTNSSSPSRPAPLSTTPPAYFRQIIAVLRLLSPKDSVFEVPGLTPKIFLTKAWETLDEHVFYTCYKFFESRNYLFTNSPVFPAVEDCDFFQNYYKARYVNRDRTVSMATWTNGTASGSNAVSPSNGAGNLNNFASPFYLDEFDDDEEDYEYEGVPPALGTVVTVPEDEESQHRRPSSHASSSSSDAGVATPGSNSTTTTSASTDPTGLATTPLPEANLSSTTNTNELDDDDLDDDNVDEDESGLGNVLISSNSASGSSGSNGSTTEVEGTVLTENMDINATPSTSSVSTAAAITSSESETSTDGDINTTHSTRQTNLII